MSDHSRSTVDKYPHGLSKIPADYLFTGYRGPDAFLTTRQYARLVSQWVSGIGLDTSVYGTHSLRRTKTALIYKRTGNLRAAQLLLGHTKIEARRNTSVLSWMMLLIYPKSRHLKLGAVQKCSAPSGHVRKRPEADHSELRNLFALGNYRRP